MITDILIRPAARGGKYLGPDAADKDPQSPLFNQSALVFLTDPATGQVVASALMDTLNMDAGPATPTCNLMAPVSRAAPYLTDATTVSVQLQVDIDVPTTFRVNVFGPLSYLDQSRYCCADITVLPGVGIGNSNNPEGVVLEVPGLCISAVSATLDGPTLSCQAVVTMMCGCKISTASGTYWPPANFSIQLVTQMASGALYTYDLGFSPANNSDSSFAGQWSNQAAPGDQVQQAWVYASEPSLGNQGQYQILPVLTAPMPHVDIETLLANLASARSAK